MVMGYPHAFSLSQENNFVNCYILAGDDLRWLNEKAAQLDGVIHDAISSSGVAEYIDVYNAFDGHGACDSNSWIHAVELGALDTSFHPRDQGQEALYNIALKQLEAGPPTPTETDTIYPSQTIATSVSVKPGEDAVAFTTDWPGSDIIMSLTSPSGRVITRTTQASDVDHQNGLTYEAYTVQNPEPGNWIVNLYGADVSADGETVHLNVNQTLHTNRPPIAVYAQPIIGTTATVSSPLTFDASESYDADGTIASYKWDFGDGTSATGNFLAHAFTQTGVYTPLLTVTDNQGAEGYVSNGPITITSPSQSSALNLPNGIIGTPYTNVLTWSSSNGPYIFSASGLPTGLALDADGALHGTPTAAGTLSVDVTAEGHGGGRGTRTYSLTIKPADNGSCVGASCAASTPELGSGELLATSLMPLGLALLFRKRRKA